ncbi:hypothetical protein [Carnobacterium maltaromaticum]|uniref:hypothetical protein n=1 Tax=Carnobacterium maltaromaticum TaxID=2751 RepID=UPI00295EDC8E|nr:hypothetical protein [Carnobacterium maltaromaticum]
MDILIKQNLEIISTISFLIVMFTINFSRDNTYDLLTKVFESMLNASIDLLNIGLSYFLASVIVSINGKEIVNSARDQGTIFSVAFVGILITLIFLVWFNRWSDSIKKELLISNYSFYKVLFKMSFIYFFTFAILIWSIYNLKN